MNMLRSRYAIELAEHNWEIEMTEFNVENRTVFLGDNLAFLRGINSESVDCIYIEPPYNGSIDFHSSAVRAEYHDPTGKETLEQKSDISAQNRELSLWLKGVKTIDQDEQERNYTYLAFLSVRLLECHRILKPTGSIFLHCDDLMSHFIKITLDCIFDEPNFRNEIICQKPLDARQLGRRRRSLTRIVDKIFWYSKSKDYTFQQQAEIEGDLWVDDDLATKSSEQLNHPSQKSLDLIKRLIQSVTCEGDIVVDAFAGSSTSAEAAEVLGRQWAMADISDETYELAKQRPGLQDVNITKTQEAPVRAEEEHGEDEHYVYVIEDTAAPGWHKIGRTETSPWTRLTDFQTGRPYRDQLKVVYSFRTSKYKGLEKHIHDKFKNRHEWVEASLHEIEDEIRRFLNIE